jgi:hypothetical protein
MDQNRSNFGMITERDYLDKTLEEATEKATSAGVVVRIVEKNGEHMMLDMSSRGDRVNFRIKNNIVTGAFGG